MRRLGASERGNARRASERVGRRAWTRRTRRPRDSRRRGRSAKRGAPCPSRRPSWPDHRPGTPRWTIRLRGRAPARKTISRDPAKRERHVAKVAGIHMTPGGVQRTAGSSRQCGLAAVAHALRELPFAGRRSRCASGPLVRKTYRPDFWAIATPSCAAPSDDGSDLRRYPARPRARDDPARWRAPRPAGRASAPATPDRRRRPTTEARQANRTSCRHRATVGLDLRAVACRARSTEQRYPGRRIRRP